MAILESSLPGRVAEGWPAVRSLLANRSHPRIATLGPVGTSSEAVARALLDGGGGAGGVMLFPSFEASAEAVMAGLTDFVLVACAYSQVNRFFFSLELSLVGICHHTTPGYGVAARSAARSPAAGIVVASHPAPLPMLADLLPPDLPYRIEETSSTSVAARRVAEGSADLCLTNESAAGHYGLSFLTSVRRISMVWTLFASASEKGDDHGRS